MVNGSVGFDSVVASVYVAVAGSVDTVTTVDGSVGVTAGSVKKKINKEANIRFH